MNRIRLICCGRCKTSYNVTDVNGSKVPMLLSCGHDMCRNCLKFMYKKNQQVICHVCSIDLNIKCDEQLYKIPIHYYLVGKVFCLTFNKKKEIYRDIDNLRMTSLTSESIKRVKKNCQSCHKCANVFCQQCDEAYCENCSNMVHVENQMMSQHDLEILDDTHPELLPTNKCDIHLKLIDFICTTCQLQLCSICAIEDHRMHDIVHLEKYNLKTVQKLNEYTSKGEMLIKNLKHCRNELREKIQYINLNQKNNNSNQNKNNVIEFVSSLIGSLQRIEQNTLDLLDQAESTVMYSLNKIINQLNTSMENIQLKLTQVDSLVKSNQCSSTMMTDAISEIERILDTTYYIAKKDKVISSVFCDHSIFNAIKLCVNLNVDVFDTYILKESQDFPEDYEMQYIITAEVNEKLPPQQPLSCSSSVLTSSNHSHSTDSGDVIRPIKCDNFHVKEIYPGDVEAVIVSNVNSPSDFFLQLHANKNVLKFVEDELNEFVSKNHDAVKCIEKNNVIYAIQRFDDKWYRAIVLHMEKEEDTIVYTMHCIDYGFLVTISDNDSDRIRNVPESISTIPVLAFNCTLYDLKPSTITGWSNEAFKLFHDLMLEKTGTYFVHPMNTTYERIEVDVIWNECTYPLSIRNALSYLGHGSSDNYRNKELLEKYLSTITLPPSMELKEKNEYLITILHFVSPSEFFFRINEQKALLEKTMDMLQSIYKPTEIEIHKSYLIYTPQIGMAVAARYSIDNCWYRAKITSFPEFRMVTVYYIDYGNSETLPWDQLRVLNKSLIEIPPLAIKGELADVRPAINSEECADWSENACALFIQLIQTTDNKEDNLSAIIHEIDDGLHKIILFNHALRGELCVNRKFVLTSHAVTSDPELCSFKKENARKLLQPESKPIQYRNKVDVCTTEDTLEFAKLWSCSDRVNHSWPKDKNDKDIPGKEMLIVKVVSPDEIILKFADYKHAKLIDDMNKMYGSQKKKNSQNLKWKINDLCAVYIQQFGNWYRGKILKLDKMKNTATINFYDLNEINDGVPVNTLFSLNKPFIDQKCGILHCCLSNLIPLGTSDNQWPKFSCDRFIEKLKKYPSVYFLKTGKKGDIALGEIWVKEIEMPEALQPVREYWLNINKYMVEQGFAMTPKQNSKVAGDSTPSFESEHNTSFDTIKHSGPINRWLSPLTLDKSRLKALVTYVDFKGHLYFQNMESDSETPQCLKQIKDELNYQFSDTQPEPSNVQWSEEQMVIAKYHYDNCWYRGSIVKKNENGEYSVQFIDYGNTEICSHEDIRSTLYMTDIPQLCYKGYFSSISPLTKDSQWQIDTLDKIHAWIVDQPCVITIEPSKSSEKNMFSIKYMKTDIIPDVCQCLVTHRLAYFNFVDVSSTGLLSTEEKSSSRSADSMVSCINDSCDDDPEDEESCDGGDDDGVCEGRSSDGAESTTALIEKSGFSRFVLDCDEIIVGTLCKVVSPVQMTLMIKMIGGIDVSKSKDRMEIEMSYKCSKLQPVTQKIPGTAVAVWHNLLWRRGVIVDYEDSVFLVDWGVSIKSVNNNVKHRTDDFYLLPMFSVNCKLMNVTVNRHVDAGRIVREMSELLRGVDLKIVWIKDLTDTAVGVELYNNEGEIAYQPLIDSKLLIPK